MGELRPLTFSVIIKRYVEIHAIYVASVFVCVHVSVVLFYSTIEYVCISWDIFVPIITLLCLSSYSIRKIPSCIFRSPHLVVINCLSCC
jgi:hypothetical protein